MIYGAFPVCRNYTVRAHIRDLGTARRRGRENRIEYARTLRCGLHAPHLHARHAPDAGKCSRKDGQFHGAGHVKKQRASERIPRISSPTLSGHFAVWVKPRNLTQKLRRSRQRTTAIFFLHFLAVFSGFLSILIPFLTSFDPRPPMCSTPVCGILCGQKQSLAGAAPVRALSCS